MFEIDAHISKVPGVDRVCCLYDNNKKQIIAIYQGIAEKKEIKNTIKEKMIKYMIPDKFINVPQMPLTENGKIDRKQLKKDYIKE